MDASGADLGGGPPLLEATSGLRRLWWAVTLAGLVLVVLGVVMVAHAATTVHVLAVIVGATLILAGLASLLDARRLGSPWSSYLLAALLLVGGVIVAAWPGESLRLLEIVVGATIVAWGALRLSTALVLSDPVSGWGAVVGLASVVLGVLVLVWPGATIWVIGIVVGLRALITGLELAVAGLVLRRSPGT